MRARIHETYIAMAGIGALTGTSWLLFHAHGVGDSYWDWQTICAWTLLGIGFLVFILLLAGKLPGLGQAEEAPQSKGVRAKGGRFKLTKTPVKGFDIGLDLEEVDAEVDEGDIER